jgi:hypothetical protein
MNREDVIKIATRVTELRAEICKLKGLQEELRTLERQLDELTGAPPVESRTRGGDSIEDRVNLFLDAHGERDWNAEGVSAALQIKIGSTRAAFSKLRKARRIYDTRRGHVRAFEPASGEAPGEGENLSIKAA